MRPTLLSVRPRALAMLVVTALFAGLLAVVAFAQPVAAAASAMTVAVKADGSVLNGEQASVTITAKNPADAQSLYNLGYTYTLPVGVSYVGASAGTAVGEPVISDVTDVNGAVVGTLLTWANVSDLVSGDAKAITFKVQSSDAEFPVGSAFTGTAQVAANSNARTVPTFGADGAPADGFTDSAKSELASTDVSALKIVKSEPSSEHELVRGVHAQPTTYTLTVTNTKQAATTGVTVTDYLPAGLEFLQCGDVEHTTSGVEYDGAQPLGTATRLASCTDPVSVDTVLGAPGEDDTKVFTKVVWDLGDLAAGAQRTIAYRAAVPLYENTMDFGGLPGGKATAAKPTAASLGQGANLDNNNGASTRQDTAGTVSNGKAQKNTAIASGSYQGRDADGETGSTQTAQDSLTVEAMDLAVHKDVAPTTFTAGQFAGYTLTIRTGEYERAEGISFTDEIPNGICPVVPANTALRVDGDGAYPSDCDPRSVSTMAKAVQGATVDSVTYHPATGGFTMAMTLAATDATDESVSPHAAAMPKNTTQKITYSGLMRSTYSATQQQGPTAVGDAFTNTVQMTGTSVGVAGDTGEQRVVDDSRATITSSGPSISKQVLSRDAMTGVTTAAQCAAQTAGYSVKDAGGFTLGDTVCFRLEVDFGAGAQTRNATVTDLLPNGTATGADWTEGADWALGGSSSGNTVAADDVEKSGETTATTATFAIGHSVDGASGTYLPQTGDTTTLVLFVAAKIGAPGSSTTKADLTQNLMKYAQQDTKGGVTSLRTMANYTVTGAPTATLEKHIVQTGPSPSELTADVDPKTTTEGRSLQYQLTVGNDPADGSDLSIAGVTMWDALPAGITCDDVEQGSITDTVGGQTVSVSCGDAPTGAAATYQDRQFIIWSGLPAIAPNGTVDLTYVVNVPDQAYVGTTYRNDASVTRFTTRTNTGDESVTWIPATGDDSVFSGSAGDGEGTAANADAHTAVAVPSAAVQKTVDKADAVPGEAVSYTYDVTIPAGTTVGKGTLVDPLSEVSGLRTSDATTWTLTLPGGASVSTRRGDAQAGTVTYSPTGQDFTLTTDGTVEFPDPFDNDGTDPLTFSVTVTGLTVSRDTGVHTSTVPPSTVRNVATFTSEDPAGHATTATDDATTAITAPNVTITKTDDLGGRPVAGNETITYTLTATNDSSTTEARSVIVADCFPSSLEFGTTTGGTIDDASSADFADLADCADGTTLHAWSVGTDGVLAPGASAVVTVTGKLTTDAPAGRRYVNTARAISSSLDTDYSDTTASFVQVASDDDTVSVASPTITKSLTAKGWNADGTANGTTSTDPSNTKPVTVRPGDSATYTIVVTVPAKVAMYAPRVQDSLPVGMTTNPGAVTATWADGSNATVASDADTEHAIDLTFQDITSSDDVRTLTITVPVTLTKAPASTTLSNTATLTWDRNAPGSDGSDVTSTKPANPANAVVVQPKLAITKDARVGSTTVTTVEPGTSFGYRVAVKNSGTAPAYGVAVTDCVPLGVEVISTDQTSTITPQGGSCAGTQVVWAARTIPAGATVTLTYSARFASDEQLTGAALRNTVTTSSYSSLPVGSDGAVYDAVSTSASVTPSFPKVDVNKGASSDLAYVGQDTTFTVTFKNTGGSAKTVAAVDTLPANWTYTSASAVISINGTAKQVEPAVDGTTLTWANLGAMPAKGTIVLTYRAAPSAAATDDPGSGFTVKHTNSVTSTVTDNAGGTSYNGGAGRFVTYEGSTTKTAATAATAIGAADLAVTKKATDARVVAGATTPKAWTITVTNTGPDAAHGTTVIDTPKDLPEGAALAFSTADTKATQWQCTPKASTWACVNGAVVAKGDAFPELDVALTLPADADLGTITNTAEIAQGPGQTFDPDSANDSDSASLTPIAQADLAITKTSNTDQAKAGQQISWTLTVQNVRDTAAGSVSDARGPITVHDDLPDTVTATSASGVGWTCSVQDDAVDCTRTGLANGASSAITVVATVHSDVTADRTIENTASVSVEPDQTSDPTPGNDTSNEVSTPVDDSTTLTVAKAFDGVLVAGEDATWKITVENVGTADARGVRVTDQLTDGTRLAGDGPETDGAWTCDVQDDRTAVTCTLDGTLAAGEETTVTLRVSTPSSLSGALANEAAVRATNAPPASAVGRSDATQTAGLVVEKTADVASVDAGREVTYTITVSNPDGPSDLPAGTPERPSIRVQDRLPEGVEFLGLSQETKDHWTLESNDGGLLTITSAAGIAVGAVDPDTIVLTVRVPASTTVPSISNRVTAQPVTAKGETAFDEVPVNVTTHADLSVVKERTSAPTADAGTDVTYDVTVHNDGPSDAQHAVWSDTTPSGMTVTKVTTDDDSWEQGADVTTWSTDTFVAGDTAVFHVTAAIASGTPAGTLRNVAAVSSATSDPDTDDDRSGADVEVTTHASLGLTKTPVAAVGERTAVKTVTAGTDQVWLLQVHNAGPSDAQPTTVVTDDLPAGLTFRSATGTAWSCDATTTPGAVVCDLSSTVVAGEDAPALWLTTAVASGYTSDALVNTARITGSGTPSTPGTNGSAESPITVGRTANVAITIGHAGTAVIGKDLPETIQVRNDGSSDADSVSVTYTLPKGLTYVSTDADPRWAVTSVKEHADGTTTVTFTLDGPLVAGTLAPAITVHQTVTVDAYPGVEPTATVTTTTPETTTADNDDADESVVAPASALSVTKTHTGAVVRGKTVGYTVTVRNDGLTEDPGPVLVTDRLPEGLTLVSVDDGGAATCTDGRTVSCTLTEPLPVDAAVAFQITVRVAEDAADRITNTASVSTPTLQSESSAQTLRPGDPKRVSDPATVSGHPRGDLAFTGAAGLGVGALLALLAMATGGVLLVLRRRRRA